MLSDYLTKNGVHFGEDYEGFSGQFPGELIILAHFARKSNVREIMEIGFNAGHSSELMLLENPNAKVTSFDLGRVRAMQYGKDYIDATFPGRHTLILGDSRNTVLEFKRNNPTKRFDLIFIDGGHTYEVAKIDMIRSSGLAHKDTIVIVDDIVHVPGWSAGWTVEPTKVWEEAKKFNEIVELGRVVDRPGIGLAWGKYLKSFELDGVFHELPDSAANP
jgi:predicted O-methyltransferase YrrM